MRSVGIKVLKNKLNEYIRLAASGETVLVTEGDRVVAELIPPREGRGAMRVDVFLAGAVRRGWITPAAFPSSVPPTRAPMAPLREILRDIESDREDR